MTLYFNSKPVSSDIDARRNTRVYCEFNNLAYGLSTISNKVKNWEKKHPGETPILNIWIHGKKKTSWEKKQKKTVTQPVEPNKIVNPDIEEQNEEEDLNILSDDEDERPVTLKVKKVKIRENRQKKPPDIKEVPITLNKKQFIGFDETVELITFTPKLPKLEIIVSETQINFEDLKRVEDLQQEVKLLKDLVDDYRSIPRNLFESKEHKFQSAEIELISKNEIIKNVMAELKQSGLTWSKEKTQLLDKISNLTAEVNKYLNENDEQRDVIHNQKEEILKLKVMLNKLVAKVKSTQK